MYVWPAGRVLQRRARSTSHLFHSLTSSFLFEVGAEVQKAGLTMVGLEAIFESADAAAARTMGRESSSVSTSRGIQSFLRVRWCLRLATRRALSRGLASLSAMMAWRRVSAFAVCSGSRKGAWGLLDSSLRKEI